MGAVIEQEKSQDCPVYSIEVKCESVGMGTGTGIGSDEESQRIVLRLYVSALK